MSFIFGGSKSKQASTSQSQSDSASQNASWNRSYDDIKSMFAPVAQFSQQAGNSLRDFLGLGQGGQGYDTYKESTGFDWGAEEGSRGIFGNAAAGRMLDSGGTRKAMMKYGNNYNSQNFNGFLDRLSQLFDKGAGAGQLLTQAGQTGYGDSVSKATSTSNSTGTSSQNNGIGGFLGAILSDRRSKEDIKRLGELKGLGVYSYKYKDREGTRIGVMADEVQKAYPEALGPKTAEGYMTVDYGKLNELVGKAR